MCLYTLTTHTCGHYSLHKTTPCPSAQLLSELYGSTSITGDPAVSPCQGAAAAAAASSSSLPSPPPSSPYAGGATSTSTVSIRHGTGNPGSSDEEEAEEEDASDVSDEEAIDKRAEEEVEEEKEEAAARERMDFVPITLHEHHDTVCAQPSCHLMASSSESVAFRVAADLRAMAKDLGSRITSLRAAIVEACRSRETSAYLDGEEAECCAGEGGAWDLLMGCRDGCGLAEECGSDGASRRRLAARDALALACLHLASVQCQIAGKVMLDGTMPPAWKAAAECLGKARAEVGRAVCEVNGWHCQR